MEQEDKDLLVELIKNEKDLIDPIARKTPENLVRLFSPTFFEFGCSGKVWERSETVQGLSSTQAPNVDATDFKLHRLGADIVLLTFKTTRLDDGDKKSSVLRSSIWKKSESGWQMMFHQGTKIPDDHKS